MRNVCLCVSCCIHIVSRSNSCRNLVLRGCAKCEVRFFDLITSRSSQMNVEACRASMLAKTSLHRWRVGDVWVGIVWACILMFVWLRGQIRVGEWTGVARSWEVARCGFLLPRNLIFKKTACVCVCFRVTDGSIQRSDEVLCRDRANLAFCRSCPRQARRVYRRLSADSRRQAAKVICRP